VGDDAVTRDDDGVGVHVIGVADGASGARATDGLGHLAVGPYFAEGYRRQRRPDGVLERRRHHRREGHLEDATLALEVLHQFGHREGEEPWCLSERRVAVLMGEEDRGDEALVALDTPGTDGRGDVDEEARHGEVLQPRCTVAEVTTLEVVNGDVRLHVVVEGDGPTVLLLHGWPDTSALWDDVVPELVAAGFRVATVDLRGCGLSDKPTELASYAMFHLVGDVAALIKALGEEKVTLVGHDWGSALAWASAIGLENMVERAVVISVGHPSAFRTAGIAQQVKSWYMLLFSYEGVGEGFLRKNDYEAMRQWVGHPRVEAVIAELERDGQMSAHLKWYRANVAPDAFIVEPGALPPVNVPVLGIWSSGDFALTEAQMTNSANYCSSGFTYRRFEGHGHWIPIEAPRELAATIVEFASA
jgi:pimeloyl-ACP methyl ester carboxylesterase